MIAAGYLGFSLIHLNHDKLIHFVTFFILTIQFYFIFDSKLKSLKILRYLTFLICTIGLSVGLEIIQSIVNPKRVFDIYDIFCNVLGSMLAIVLAIIYQHLVLKNKRKNRARKQPPIIEDPEESSSDITEEDYVTIQMDDIGDNHASNSR